MTTGKRKAGGCDQQRTGGGRAAVLDGQPHNSTSTAEIQSPCDPRRDPIALAHAQRAEEARAAGDRAAFWNERRAMLLRQAELMGAPRSWQ